MAPTFIDRVLGSDIPYITYAVPVFFLLIGVELVAAVRQRHRFYRLHDSISDLSCGSTEQILGIFLKGLLFAGYQTTYAMATRSGLSPIDVHSLSDSGAWAAAVLLFFGIDLAYYWSHRICHEYNAPWAGHVVHHSSEEYNLSVALRQGAFQGFFTWVFYLPMAVLGFPPSWFAAVLSFNLIYQFGIHTRLIGKLGPLEWVLNTPSHHRVHHARNPRYLDRNYAGTLIVWDRLFGTFQAEDEEPVFGLKKPLNSWNPLWANLHIWRDLIRDAVRAPRPIDKLRIWFMPQGWRPEGLPAMSEAPAVPYETRVPRWLDLYALAHFGAGVLMTLAVMAAGDDPNRVEVMVGAVLVLWALANLGGILELRGWSLPSELIRLPVTAAAVSMIVPVGPWRLLLVSALSATVVASWLGLLAHRRHFLGAPRSSDRASGSPTFQPEGAGEIAPPLRTADDCRDPALASRP